MPVVFHPLQKLGFEWQKISVISYTYDIIMRCDPSITGHDKKPRACKLYIIVEGLLQGSRLLSAGGNVADAVEDSKHKVQTMSSTATVSAMVLAVRSGY